MPAGKLSSITVVVPAYNSEGTLRTLVERLAPVLEHMAEAAEVVLVNDGSRDRTWEAITELASEFKMVRGLNLARNFGQHNALLAGVRAARHEFIVTMDDDLQNPPEELPKLASKIQEGWDVVYGTPERQQHGFLRDTASWLTKTALRSFLGAESARNASAFRLFRAGLRESFAGYAAANVSIDVLLSWGTTRFTHVSVRHDPRENGASNYSLAKLVLHAIDMVIGFSTLPLKIASLLGFAFTILGGLLFAYVLIRWLLSGSAVPGFAFLASSIAVFSGVQLFSLGVLGEYIARIYVRSQGQPSYVVREATSAREGDGAP